MEQQKKRMGRPPKAPEDRRRHHQSFRTSEKLRAALQEAADANQRSMSEEAEYRLEASFDAERRLADQSSGLKLALRAVERTWQFLEERISDEWADHESGKAAMRQAMLDVINFGFPAKLREEMTEAERVELDQLLSQVEIVTDMVTWRKNDPPKAFPDNRLLQAANRPLPFAEAHRRWQKQRAAKVEA